MKWKLFLLPHHKSHNLALEKLCLTEMLAIPSGLAPSPVGGRGSGHVRDAARETHKCGIGTDPVATATSCSKCRLHIAANDGF